MMIRPDCVMLAAGRSRRMEQWKMTLPLGETTLVERSVSTALEACGRVILVAGHRAAELVELFEGRERVQVVVNPEYEQGMFSSVRRGVAEVGSPRFFVALGDMPLVDPGTYHLLVGLAEELPEAAGVRIPALIPRYHGKKGHPLLLAALVRERILAATPAVTLRDVLAEVPNLLVPVEDPHVLQDVDTPEDYRGLLSPES
ncbi:MAG: NTP transferase domain-containing protein [Spirochaetales bacterium]|nr:NTP transferase domain-containing protein [Spirochaetales bacterium]